jgi:hypothetical protein
MTLERPSQVCLRNIHQTIKKINSTSLTYGKLLAKWSTNSFRGIYYFSCYYCALNMSDP